jgi:presenilin-like A22 family membrane protease
MVRKLFTDALSRYDKQVREDHTAYQQIMAAYEACEHRGHYLLVGRAILPDLLVVSAERIPPASRLRWPRR